MLSSECSIEDILKARPKRVARLCQNSPTITEAEHAVKKLSDTICCKIGTKVTYSEFLNQQFAWKNLSGGLLRVPEPYRFFDFQDETGEMMGHLVMELLPGRTPACTATTLGEDTSRTIEAIQTLHERSRNCNNSVRPGPPSGACAEGFPWDGEAEKPFSSLEDLKFCLQRRLPGEDLRLGDLSAGLTLVHGDLGPWNWVLMERGEVGLLDWATAAYYPVSFEVAALRSLMQRTEGGEREFLKSVLTCIQVKSKTLDEEIEQLGRIHSRSLCYAFGLHSG